MRSSIVIDMPDFSALVGWDNSWAPDTNATGVDYSLAGSSRLEDLLETNPF